MGKVEFVIQITKLVMGAIALYLLIRHIEII